MSEWMPSAAAIHEAGHATAAQWCGITPERIMLHSDGSGHTALPHLLPAQAVRGPGGETDFPIWLTILRAGVEAERRLLGRVEPGSGAEDDAKIAEWVQTYARVYRPPWMQAADQQARAYLATFFAEKRLREAVVVLGRRLEQRRVLLRDQIAETTLPAIDAGAFEKQQALALAVARERSQDLVAEWHRTLTWGMGWQARHRAV